MRLQHLRVKSNCLTVFADGFLGFLLGCVNIAQIEMRGGIVRLLRQIFFVIGLRRGIVFRIGFRFGLHEQIMQRLLLRRNDADTFARCLPRLRRTRRNGGKNKKRRGDEPAPAHAASRFHGEV